MNSLQKNFLVINIIGGSAVLLSYLWGVNLPDAGTLLWGGMPENLRPLYSVSMFTAAAGYLLCFSYILMNYSQNSNNAAGMAVINRWYMAILLCSAVWLPLTIALTSSYSHWLWAVIRVELLVTGIGALAVLHRLLKDRLSTGSASGGLFFLLAALGQTAFVFQTAVLDALVWPWFFLGN